MDHFEMVEKLREKAQVSYEDAREALEKTDWDLLDALVYLEKAGKVAGADSASYSTRVEQKPRPERREESGKGMFQRLLEGFATVINQANKVSLEIMHKGKLVLTLPLLALVLLVVFCFWIVAPLLVIGLFLGFTYRFKGASAVDAVNRAMDKAADVAQNIKTGAGNGNNSAD